MAGAKGIGVGVAVGMGARGGAYFDQGMANGKGELRQVITVRQGMSQAASALPTSSIFILVGEEVATQSPLLLATQSPLLLPPPRLARYGRASLTAAATCPDSRLPIDR